MSEDLVLPTGELRLVEDVPAAFAGLVRQLSDERDDLESASLRLALSGGATARACYEELARDGGVTWEAVECFLGDERCVPPADVDANQAMIREALVDRVPVRGFHPMVCELVEDYDALVARSLPLDLVHLGLGPDGHTASLFPGSEALESPPGRLVVHNVDPSGNNPHERMTFTFEAIERCRMAVFTVSGEAKHDAFHRILSGERLPAARVRAGRVLWLCDREALGEDLGRVA